MFVYSPAFWGLTKADASAAATDSPPAVPHPAHSARDTGHNAPDDGGGDDDGDVDDDDGGDTCIRYIRQNMRCLTRAGGRVCLARYTSGLIRTLQLQCQSCSGIKSFVMCCELESSAFTDSSGIILPPNAH
jgi:hypothetical protein